MKLKLTFSLILILSSKILSCDYICPPKDLFSIDSISEGTVRKINFPPIPSWTPFPYADSLFKDTVSIDTYSVAILDSVFHHYYDSSNYIFSGKIVSKKEYRVDSAVVDSFCLYLDTSRSTRLCVPRYEYTSYDSIKYCISYCMKGGLSPGDTLYFYSINTHTKTFGIECPRDETGYIFIENSLIFCSSKDGPFPYPLYTADFIDRECSIERSNGRWLYFNKADTSLMLWGYPGLSIRVRDALNGPSKINTFKKYSSHLKITHFFSASSLIIQFSEPLHSADISIFNLSGKLIFRDNHFYGSIYRMDIKNKPKGCYLLNLKMPQRTLEKSLLFFIN